MRREKEMRAIGRLKRRAKGMGAEEERQKKRAEEEEGGSSGRTIACEERKRREKRRGNVVRFAENKIVSGRAEFCFSGQKTSILSQKTIIKKQNKHIKKKKRAEARREVCEKSEV